VGQVLPDDPEQKKRILLQTPELQFLFKINRWHEELTQNGSMM
jgi:hypothetical protein